MSSTRREFSDYVDRFPLEERGTISNDVTEIIRGAILDGVFEPGAWLREARLAKDLEVSRTPVRDALRTLAAEGFLSLHANQGAVVAPMSTDDIIELYTVREALEGLAARLAARRASDQIRRELSELLEKMRKAGDEERFDDLSELNLEFHRIVRHAAGNRYLERSLAQIAAAVRRFRHSTFELPGRTEGSFQEHEKIAEAIMNRDADAAEALATDHIGRLAKLRLQMLLEGY